MIITAPFESFVDAIFVSEGTAVDAGQRIFALSTLPFQREIQKLQLRQYSLQWRQRLIDQQRTDEQLRVLDDVVELTTASLNKAREIHFQMGSRFAVGEVTLADVVAEENNVLAEENRLRTAQTERATIPVRVGAEREILSVEVKKSGLELVEFRRKENGAVVVAQRAGKVVRILSGPGAFVEVGDPIMEVADGQAG